MLPHAAVSPVTMDSIVGKRFCCLKVERDVLLKAYFAFLVVICRQVEEAYMILSEKIDYKI